ncbi:hypothetical protein, partial [Komagataeibacter melaceti]|uniref:hypothetical protein n=1 Tax=Komagataeibacter melaceti TaxID=2766577 RepID=UPI0019D4C8FF
STGEAQEVSSAPPVKRDIGPPQLTVNQKMMGKWKLNARNQINRGKPPLMKNNFLQDGTAARPAFRFGKLCRSMSA